MATTHRICRRNPSQPLTRTGRDSTVASGIRPCPYGVKLHGGWHDKTTDFFDTYLGALFRRGKSPVLPLDYLLKEAGKVLKGEGEMAQFEKTLEAFVADGRIIKSDEGYALSS
nr:hypothetical protein [uncultured Cohaesibacter sp.]